MIQMIHKERLVWLGHLGEDRVDSQRTGALKCLGMSAGYLGSLCCTHAKGYWSEQMLRAVRDSCLGQFWTTEFWRPLLGPVKCEERRRKVFHGYLLYLGVWHLRAELRSVGQLPAAIFLIPDFFLPIPEFRNGDNWKWKQRSNLIPENEAPQKYLQFLATVQVAGERCRLRQGQVRQKCQTGTVMRDVQHTAGTSLSLMHYV